MSKPTVAIVGASANRSKFGNKSVRAHAKCGYEVFPINPRSEQIEGLASYSTLSETPYRKFDRICLYLQSEIGILLLEEIAKFSCKQLWLNPGSYNKDLVEKARGLKLPSIIGCSIIDLGVSPQEFPDEDGR